MAAFELNSKKLAKYTRQILFYKAKVCNVRVNRREINKKLEKQLQQKCKVMLKDCMVLNEIQQIDKKVQKNEENNKASKNMLKLQQTQEEAEAVHKTQKITKLTEEEEAAAAAAIGTITATTNVQINEIKKYNNNNNSNSNSNSNNVTTTTVVISVPRVLGTAIYDNAVSINLGAPDNLMHILTPQIRNLLNTNEQNESLRATNFLQQINDAKLEAPKVIKKKKTYKRKSNTDTADTDQAPIKKKRGRKPKSKPTIPTTTTTTITVAAAEEQQATISLREYLENASWIYEDDVATTNTSNWLEPTLQPNDSMQNELQYSLMNVNNDLASDLNIESLENLFTNNNNNNEQNALAMEQTNMQNTSIIPYDATVAQINATFNAFGEPYKSPRDAAFREALSMPIIYDNNKNSETTVTSDTTNTNNNNNDNLSSSLLDLLSQDTSAVQSEQEPALSADEVPCSMRNMDLVADLENFVDSIANSQLNDNDWDATVFSVMENNNKMESDSALSQRQKNEESIERGEHGLCLNDFSQRFKAEAPIAEKPQILNVIVLNTSELGAEEQSESIVTSDEEERGVQQCMKDIEQGEMAEQSRAVSEEEEEEELRTIATEAKDISKMAIVRKCLVLVARTRIKGRIREEEDVKRLSKNGRRRKLRILLDKNEIWKVIQQQQQRQQQQQQQLSRCLLCRKKIYCCHYSRIVVFVFN